MLEENQNIGEQPETSIVQPVATDLGKGTELNEGSPLGKFKDAQKLLDAYNELQSEFTRKCQKLSDAEKKLQSQVSQSNNEISTSNENLERNEFAWKNNVREFLQSHKNAGQYVEDITKEIIEDETLKYSVDGLEKAYARVMEKKYIPEADLASNKEFLDKYIYNNEEIKNKIIKEYVSSLQNAQNPVNVNNSGFTRGIASSNTINNFDDAKKYVEKMFRF